MGKSSAAQATGDDGTAFVARLRAALGYEAVTTDAETLAPHLVEPRGLYSGKALALARPRTTEEVAAIVKLAATEGRAIVPQGGNTGLVGGGIPFDDGRAIIVSLSRMNRIRALDAENFTITVEAGCILEKVQEAAAEADRLFPLSLGAEGSCQIGGNLSTNAGGVHVLRYGTMRDLVLGLEVVLPGGEVWNGLKRLRKDNTGYDLKQLFIGGEGTLGIITAAVLKLFPRPRQTATAFVALGELEAANKVLARLRAASGDRLEACELCPRLGLDFAIRHVTGIRDPLAARHDWYLLVAMTSGSEEDALGETLENALGALIEEGAVADAAIAANESQAGDFWRIREALVEAQKHEGGSIKHDVSVPVSAVPNFIRRATALVEKLVPGIRPVPFGHLGDGNIHFNLSQPEGGDRKAFLARWDEVSEKVHDIVVELGGSISAEHGIGRMKIAENARTKSEVELETMRRIKAALDPANIMNPGKML